MQRLMLRRLMLVMLTLLLLPACGASDVRNPSLAPSLTPGPTSQPTFTEGRPSEPPAVTSSPLEPHGEAFRLRPDWEVETISSLYTQFFREGAFRNFQRVDRAGAFYLRHDRSVVAAEEVREFIRSLDKLYLSDGYGHWTAHFHYDPSWLIVVQGADGEELRITSTSSGYPGHAPWNIEYQGRIYHQYDGSLATPLARLFPDEADDVSTSYDLYPQEDESERIQFFVEPPHDERIEEVSGLFPLGVGVATVDASGLSAHMVSPNVVVDGKVDVPFVAELLAVELATAAGQVVECQFKPNDISERGEEEWERGFSGWDFSCPIGALTDQADRFPITVRLTDSQGQAQVLTGEIGQNAAPASASVVESVSPILDATLLAHPSLQDLLTDHQLVHMPYLASIDPLDPHKGARTGEVRLLGETLVDGQPVPYTISTPFGVTDGAVSYWTLSRATLDEMLQSITSSQLARRMLAHKPQTVIDLWYAAGVPPVMAARGVAGNFPSYTLERVPCGDIPGGILPTPDEPLQQFSFNETTQYGMSNSDFRDIEFTMHDERIVVTDLFDAELFKLFAPVSLEPWMRSEFRVQLYADRYWGEMRYGHHALVFSPSSEDATADERAALASMAQQLSAKAAQDGDDWVVKRLALTVGDDGRLVPMACS
jgi:hypothetical protein